MISRPASPHAIAATITRSDYLRRSSSRPDERTGHREWLHFSVADGDLRLFVNFSVMDNPRASPSGTSETARLLVLAFVDGRWEGDVEEFAADEIALWGGRVFAKLGANQVELRDGVFHITVRMRERPISFALVLSPMCFPSLASNVGLGTEAPINWLVVPRLRADGWIAIGDRRRLVQGATAYHDHNWGHFLHRDFAWQWGYAHGDDPATPYSVVFIRLMNRAKTSVFMQALLLWSGARQYRVMREDEIEVQAQGFVRCRPMTVPRTAALLVSSAAIDVPQRFRFDGRGAGDALDCCFQATDVARVIVPHQHDLGTTVIHEVVGRVVVAGHVRGEPISLDGPGVFEFLGSGE